MARSAFLDPEHSYFRRFRTAFARWGALMPLLGQPFVLAGDALARVAPERDEVEAAGHRFRVEQWPPLGAAGQASYSPPAPQTGGEAVQSLAIVSFLANGLAVPQGAIVGEVRLWGGGTEVLLPLRAGVETAEWAIDRPDVAGQAGHRRAEVAGHWIGQPRGNLYLALTGPPAAPGGGGVGATPRPRLGGDAIAPPGGRVPYGRGLGRRAHRGALLVGPGDAGLLHPLRLRHPERLHHRRRRVLVYALARRFGYSTTVSALAALGFGLGTMAWPYARLDFSEPAATLFVLLAIWAFYQACPPSVPGQSSQGASRADGRRGPALVAGLLGAGSSGALLLAIAGKYTSALFGLALVAQWALSSAWWRPQRRRQALTYLGALVLPLLLLGAAGVGVAFAFTGEVPIVLSPAQVLGRIGEDWLALPLWTGLRGLLFSPGRSLFLYSPWLLLAIPGVVLFMRRHGRSGFLVAVFPILVVLLYAMKLGWHGGSWGPRYLLPVVPLLAVACAPALLWLLRAGTGGATRAGGAGRLRGRGADPGAGQGPRALPGDGAGVRRPRPPRWREPAWGGGTTGWPGAAPAWGGPCRTPRREARGGAWATSGATLTPRSWWRRGSRGASPSPSTLWTGTARAGASGSRSKTPGGRGCGTWIGASGTACGPPGTSRPRRSAPCGCPCTRRDRIRRWSPPPRSTRLAAGAGDGLAGQGA